MLNNMVYDEDDCFPC